MNLRFDDTNPEKESIEYINSIKDDINWLGFKWENECYASDYFDQLYEWSVDLIKNKKAYVDSQDQKPYQNNEVSQLSLEQKSLRDRSVSENIDLFHKMKLEV